jgi:hypothetical protein
MKKISLLLFLITLAFTLYSCASSIPRVDAVHEEWAQRRWGEIHLSEARKLYADNCSGCHSLHSPMEHTEKEWEALIGEMAGKAHLNPRDSVSVLAYLESFSKDNSKKL